MTGRALERLRKATREVHARIDSGPYARAVLDGSLPIAEYASFLRALHAIHVELEQAIEAFGHTNVGSAYARSAERRARLEQDLAYLPAVDAAVLPATVLTQQLRLDARRSPDTLLGYCYVLEGSQLGGLALAPALAKRAELERGGLAYLSGAGRDTASQFKTFCAFLEANLSDPAALEQAALGAQHAFAGFEAILDTLAARAAVAR